MPKPELALYDKALKEWGLTAQAGMLMEECAELIAATNQWLRGRGNVDHLVEEMVDADLMLKQIRRAINDEALWDRWQKVKLERLRSLLLPQVEGQ